MPAVYNPGAALSIFQTGSHPDQIGVNDAPANAPGTNWSPGLVGLSNFYVHSTSTDVCPLNIYKVIDQTQRAYDGSDTIRTGQCMAMFMSDCDYNDATQSPVGLINRGVMVNQRYGKNATHYGSGLGVVTYINVINSGSSANEFALNHGYVLMGTAAAPTAGAMWGVGDWGTYGPVGLQGNVYCGASLVTRNYYNGSPAFGPSVGWAIQNLPSSGPGSNPTGSTATYPLDVGYIATGWSANGTHDAYAVAFQAGGRCSPWGADTWHNGTLDTGQVGIGFGVPARLDGVTPCSRVGAFVSRGLGEAGGLVFGTDTTDATRSSIYRAASWNLTLTGCVSIASHYGPITADVDGATITFDLRASDWHTVTLGGARTLALANPTVGQQFSLILKQDGTGSRTVTWFGGILWPGGTVPTLTTGANKSDVFTFKCISAGVYLGFTAGQNH